MKTESQLKLLIFYEFQLKLIENLKLSHVQIDKDVNLDRVVYENHVT